MADVIESIQSNISAFDLIAFLIIVYSMAQCAAKGFTISLLSFSKWLLALIITIILVPKLNPWVRDYIDSEFIADVRRTLDLGNKVIIPCFALGRSQERQTIGIYNIYYRGRLCQRIHYQVKRCQYSSSIQS